MNKTVKKYFWSLNERALEETAAVLRDHENPKFALKAITLLSLCDRPQEAFRVIPEEIFISHWPAIKRKWKRSNREQTLLHWWDSIYRTLIGKEDKISAKQRSKFLRFIGKQIQSARLKKEWSQKDLSDRVNTEQRLISEIENGKANITMETLLKLARALEIDTINLLPPSE